MNLWPFKKTESIKLPLQQEIIESWECPPQQLFFKKCVCMMCKSKGQCSTEKLVASSRNCENQWISYCSIPLSNKKDSAFNAILGDYYINLKWRLVDK